MRASDHSEQFLFESLLEWDKFSGDLISYGMWRYIKIEKRYMQFKKIMYVKMLQEIISIKISGGEWLTPNVIRDNIHKLST